MNTLTELKTEILVFSTSISNKDDLKLLEKVLNPLSEVLAWNVDLEDWEKIPSRCGYMDNSIELPTYPHYNNSNIKILQWCKTKGNITAVRCCA